MEESFRSTKPITEFALNVLYRLQPEQLNGDHGELIERGLIEQIDRNGEEWWDVRFNQTHGPNPIVKSFTDINAEFDALGDQLAKWLTIEGVRPNDICVLYNGESIKTRLEAQVEAKLRKVGAHLEVQKGTAFTRDANTIIASTAQSYKGYESEIVVIAGADKFITGEKVILANNLYVAMTRARSLLAIYGMKSKNENSGRIMSVLSECLELLKEIPSVQEESSLVDLAEELIQLIGPKHRTWLKSIMKSHVIEQDPIHADDGEIIAEPLFWFNQNGRVYACYSDEPKQVVKHRLEDAGIVLILPGDEAVRIGSQAPILMPV